MDFWDFKTLSWTDIELKEEAHTYLFHFIYSFDFVSFCFMVQSQMRS